MHVVANKNCFRISQRNGKIYCDKRNEDKKKKKNKEREETQERACATSAHLATESFYSAFSTCRRRANVGGLIPRQDRTACNAYYLECRLQNNYISRYM